MERCGDLGEQSVGYTTLSWLLGLNLFIFGPFGPAGTDENHRYIKYGVN